MQPRRQRKPRSAREQMMGFFMRQRASACMWKVKGECVLSVACQPSSQTRIHITYTHAPTRTLHTFDRFSSIRFAPRATYALSLSLYLSLKNMHIQEEHRHKEKPSLQYSAIKSEKPHQRPERDLVISPGMIFLLCVCMRAVFAKQ